MEKLVQYICHSVKGCLFAFDGSNIYIEQQTRLNMIRIDQVIELVKLLLQELQPFFDYTALNRITISVHGLKLILHEGKFFADFVFVEYISAVHFFDLGFSRFYE